MRVRKFFPAILTAVFFCYAVAFGQDNAPAVSAGNATDQEATVKATTSDPAADPAENGSEGNLLWIEDAAGAAGGVTTVNVFLTVDQDIYGAQFDLIFDQSKLQIKPLAEDGIKVGADAGGLLELVLDDDAVTAVNSEGKLVVMLVDTTLATPMTAGTEKELFNVKFTVDENAELGDVPITLANVSLATIVDTVATEILVSTQDGKVTIVEFQKGDVSGDGNVNIFDLLDLLKVLSGSGTAGGAVDVNGDGDINIFDLLELLKVLAG
ncbi:MAG: cohesin domain-containing protein [Candidatus Aminicenantaceae bacterium]